jgi:hypothetical protein
VVGTLSSRMAKTATLVNGVVRTQDDSNVNASLILESHYFFTQNVDFLGAVDKKLWGHGPFIAIRSGGTNNQLIDSIGLGWMLGFRYNKKQRAVGTLEVAPR